MKFKWSDLWNVGEHLRKYSKKEEFQRSAVERYYYACFLTARDYYEAENKKPLVKFDSHNTLIKFFITSYEKDHNEIGRKLIILRKYRNKADYEENFQNIIVNKSQEESKKLIKILEGL